MDWNAFFEKTLAASGADSYAKLAPKLGVSDGAISHYRTGKRTPQAWVVAAALRIQGSSNPEREAAELMKGAAPTSSERAFWRRLSAAAALVLLVGAAALPSPAAARDASNVYYVKFLRLLRMARSRPLGLTPLPV